MKRRITILLTSIILVTSLPFNSTAQSNSNYFNLQKALNIYMTMFRELNQYYVDTIDPEKVTETAIEAMLKTLDPYTVYYPASDVDDVKFLTTGEYGGIGAVISKHGDDVIIREPYTGTPSMKAGLLPGDIFVSINGVSMEGKSSQDATEILRGAPGDELVLVMKRENIPDPFEVRLKREKIQLPNIPYYGLLQDTVGYIYLSSFTETSAADFKKAAMELKKEGATSFIIDLRNNGGGLLDQAAEIVGMFVPKGSLVVTTKGRTSQINKEIRTTKSPIFPDFPLVVLINSASASASEIVAGALQDMDRAVLVGERSFGKGLVQNVLDLPYNSKLKVTTAKYYIPSGRCVQAIDYSHRNADGSVGKVPDSLRHEFKTAGGRSVYDGGGIEPDIAVEEPENISILTQELVLDDIIFDFVNSYALYHDAPTNVLDFELTDEVYEEFKEYLNTRDFDYVTRSYGEIKSLESALKREKYYDGVEEEFEALKELLEPNVERDLELFEKEARDMLCYEFIARYYRNEGSIEYTIHHDDPYTIAALSALSTGPDHYLSSKE